MAIDFNLNIDAVEKPIDLNKIFSIEMFASSFEGFFADKIKGNLRPKIVRLLIGDHTNYLDGYIDALIWSSGYAGIVISPRKLKDTLVYNLPQFGYTPVTLDYNCDVC